MIRAAAYSQIEHFRSAAERAHVYVGDTSATQWFQICAGDLPVGCCAVRTMRPGIVRLKAAFIVAQWRGKGLGLLAVEHRERYAREVLGASKLEVLAYNWSFWKARGYHEVSRLRNGAVRMVRNV